MIEKLRKKLGMKWSVVALLVPPSLFGIFFFGISAAVVLTTSVLACMMAGMIVARFNGRKIIPFNAGSIITGLLIGLTLSANTPIYMIISGALVAEFIGKGSIPFFQRNPFNPAIVGRSAIAILETISPISYSADVTTSASALFKDGGGHLSPEFSDLFLGLTKGAIGETSAIILIVVGILMLRYVALKKEPTLAMILTVPVAVFVLPPPVEIIGHAPWVDNPLIYLLGGSTLLLAVFFLTDPMTMPRTKMGGIVFGICVATIGVAGKFYTQTPGWDMYGILIMNAATPTLDKIFRKKKRKETT